MHYGKSYSEALDHWARETSNTLIIPIPFNSKSLPGSSGSDYVVRSPYSDVQLPTEDIHALVVTKNFSSYGSRVGLIDGISIRTMR